MTINELVDYFSVTYNSNNCFYDDTVLSNELKRVNNNTNKERIISMLIDFYNRYECMYETIEVDNGDDFVNHLNKLFNEKKIDKCFYIDNIIRFNRNNPNQLSKKYLKNFFEKTSSKY